jgi:hypothetical protein
MTSRLTFSERGHTYALDGKRLPGVTTIIRNATDKPALVNAAAKEAGIWAAANMEALAILGTDTWVRQAAAAPRTVWRAKASRGTLLHEAARQLVRGDPLAPANEAGEVWPDDVIRSAEQLARFMDEWDAQPVLAERPVFHEAHGWAGTLDLVADLRDGRRWLLDYKTGETGVYPETSVQLAAYRHASHVQEATEDGPEDRPMVQVDRAGVVWVRPDGYELRPVRADVTVYQIFLRMMAVSAWASWPREESVGDPLPVPVGQAS